MRIIRIGIGIEIETQIITVSPICITKTKSSHIIQTGRCSEFCSQLLFIQN